MQWTQCYPLLLNHVCVLMESDTKSLSVLCGAWGGGLERVSVDAIGSIQMSVI